MRLGGHVLPDLSSLTTYYLQEYVLQILCEHAVIAFKSLKEGNLRIRRIMTTFNQRDTSQNLLVDCHNSRSKAKKTIEHYTNFDAPPTSRHIVTKSDGILYPKKPCNVSISKWPADFSGYLVCKSTSHRFVFCPDKGNVNTNKLLL